MITMRADTHNKQVLVDIGEAANTIQAGIREAFATIGKENVQYARNLIKSPPKTGIVYKIGGRTHQASAPYEPPANFSGRLQRSVKSKVYGHTKMEFGDYVLYGLFLEEGTKNKIGRVKMKPRPHLKTTVREKQRDNFITLEHTVYNKLNKKP